MTAKDARVQLTFGVWNALTATILLVALFLIVQPRFWAFDVPLCLSALVQLTSAAGLLAKRGWALRALSVSAWLSFGLGLFVISSIVVSMVFLRSIHGDYGVAALAVSGLIVALLVPYLLVLPALQLLWLKARQSTAAGAGVGA